MQVEEAQMQPFWNLLLTHLKCTLTHLSPTVRYSTLSFFELLIVSFPKLVANSDSVILPSLLGLISSSEENNGSATTTGSAAVKPRLKVEISGKHNNVRERLRVFTLIGSCLRLKALSTHQNSSWKSSTAEDKDDNKDDGDSIEIFSSNLALEGGVKKKRRQEHLGVYYPMGYDLLTTGQSNNDLCLSFSHGSDAQVDILGTAHQYHSSPLASGEDENQFWPRFVQSTLAILTETWVEAASNNSATGSSASASKEPKQAEKKPGFQGVKQKQEMDFNIAGLSLF